MLHYCTYFDHNYLARAMALHESLLRHSPDFTLWVLALDDEAHRLLDALGLHGVRIVSLAELEAADPELLDTKTSRSTVEYYFTCSPSLPRYLLATHVDIDLITYLDADLYFFADLRPMLAELEDASVGIVPHRFAEGFEDRVVYGKYNVAVVAFRRDADGLRVLEGWRRDCLEWCHDYVEGDRYADQKYLDRWPAMAGVKVISHPGIDVAPWNVNRHQIDWTASPPVVDGKPLIVYHFQGLKEVRAGVWDLGLSPYRVPRRRVERFYRAYIERLVEKAEVLGALDGGPHSAGSSPRYRVRLHRLVLKQLQGQLLRLPPRS